MSIVIHHGHPGSYKSSGVIQREVIPQLLDGRVIVTNVRGFNSVDAVENAMGREAAETAAIMYVDTETAAGRLHMGQFFHWAPKGALILIDEAQDIFPVRRRDFKLEQLDYPGGPEAAARDERPYDICNAFDMHRHHNWDIYLCTTNIKKIHSEIREAAQVAFRHYSMGELLPWKKGRWREVEHDPENNGKSDSHAYGIPKEYRIDPRTFQCYQSTKTGEHRENAGPGNILKDKKLITISVVVIACVIGFIYFAVDIFNREINRSKTAPVDSETRGTAIVNDATNGDNGRVNTVGVAVHGVLRHPFADAVLRISGRVGNSIMFEGVDNEGAFSVTDRELLTYGYSLVALSGCHVRLLFGVDVAQDVYCTRRYIREDDGNQYMIEPSIIDHATAALGSGA